MFRTTSSGAGRLAIGLVLGVVLGLSTVGGVAVGQAVYDANNAHKVDGKHAVGAGASKSARAGKLVATNGQGQFPVGAVPRFESFATATGENAVNVTATANTLLPGATVQIKMKRAGTLVAQFGAESACSGGNAVSWCGIDLVVTGGALSNAPMDGESDDAFDSNDSATETSSSWESHAVVRTLAVPAGTYTVSALTNIFNAGTASSFRVDDWNLVVEGKM